MAWYRVDGGGLPNSVKTDMNNVLNKKMGTSGQTYPPKEWADDVNLMGMLEEKTISGSVASCSDGADAVPVKSWEIEIEPNLNGKSQIIATQFQGINFFNEDWEVGGINDTTGLPNSDTNKIRSKTFSRIRGGVTIYIKTPQPIRVLFYKDDETFISETANIRNNTFTVPSNASLFKIRGTVDYGTTYNDDISINYPSTDTDYHAYVSAPVDNTVNLGRTIYGGQADVVNGTGVETYLKIVLDGTQEIGLANWKPTTGTSAWLYAPSVTPNLLNNYLTAYNLDNIVCDVLPTVPYNTTAQRIDESTTKGISVVGTNNWGLAVRVEDDTLRTKTDINAWLANNPIIVIYKVATQTDFTFTPIMPTPETALGVNNFWAATGDSEVVYRSSGTVTPVVPTLISKSITENGTYNASSDNADGYDEVTVNVPQGSTIPFEKVWSSGNTGAETFTCTEAGKYLFMVGTSARGTATITSSVTADFTSSKQGSDGRGLVIAVYTLAVGDTVTMTNTIVDWVYRFKAVFKTSLSVSAMVDSTIVTDGTLSSFSPTFTGDALFVYMAGGRADTNSYDRTYSTDNFEWASKCETQTFIRLSYGSDTPTPSLYGYDGGCALAICLQ